MNESNADFVRRTVTLAKQIECVRKEYGTQHFTVKNEKYRVEKDRGAFVGYRVYSSERFLKQIRAKSFMAALLKVLMDLGE